MTPLEWWMAKMRQQGKDPLKPLGAQANVCKCGMAIKWAVGPDGKPLALDFAPSHQGQWKVRAVNGRLYGIAAERLFDPPNTEYWATHVCRRR